MIQKLIQLLFIVCVAGVTMTVRAQKVVLRRPFIGDTVPGIVPLNMMNYESERERLSAFRGKWLILDFWATYCHACINAMPGLYAIQQDFKDKLNVVLVTHESQEKVKTLLAKSLVAKGTEFPFVVEDTLLHKLFPHKYIPHEVWIDPHGVLRAITDHHAVTSENVRDMLSGSITSLPEKKDVMMENTRDSDEKVLYKAVLSRLKDPNSGRYGVKLDSTTGDHWYNQIPYQFHAQGMPALQLFYKSFVLSVHGWGLANINRKRIVFEITDTLLYNRYAKNLVEHKKVSPRRNQFPYLTWKDKQEYNREMRYDYQYTIPDALPVKQLGKLVLADLNRYFPIKGKIEKRNKLCWILVADETAEGRLRTQGEGSRIILNPDSLGVENYPFFKFADLFISGFLDTPPIINETNLDRQMMVDIGLHLSDSPGFDPKQGMVVNNPLHFETAKRELNKYGLDLVKDNRMVPVLVIYDE